MSAKGKTGKRKGAPPQAVSPKKGDTAGRSRTESDACRTPVWRGTTSSSVVGPSKKQRPEQRKDEGAPDGHPERAFFDSSVKEAASSDSEDADDVGVGTDCPHCMKEDNPHSPRMWEKYADSVGICEVHPSLCGDCTTANCIDGDDEECKKVENTGLGYPDPVPCSICGWPTRDIDRVSPTCVVCTEVKHARCDTNATNATDDDDLDYLCATCEGTTHGRCCVCESVSQYEGGKMGGLFDAMFYCCECIAVRERRE